MSYTINTVPYKNKILFITGYFPLRHGGAEYQAYFLAERLKTIADVYFCFRDHWAKNKILKEDGFTLYPIKPSRFKRISKPYIFESAPLNQILKKIVPSSIYVRGANAYLGIAASYAKKTGTRLIWHIAHDKDVQPFQASSFKNAPFEFIDKRAVEYGMKRANYIIAQTQCQAKMLEKNYKLKSEFVIGNWHPTHDICNKQKNKVIVLWIANWKSIKQPEIYIELAKHLSSLKDVVFKMIGRPGNYTRELLAAQEAGIEVLGALPNEEVNELLTEGHILVNTSKQEGFSNTFIQAWMRKVPVVSLQADPDNVLEKEGIGVCSGDFEQLVEDTRRLIIDEKLRGQMGDRARTHAIEHHSLKNMDTIIDLMTR